VHLFVWDVEKAFQVTIYVWKIKLKNAVFSRNALLSNIFHRMPFNSTSFTHLAGYGLQYCYRRGRDAM
jgi:hypothetical protein